jgi:hypothetical protein
MATRFARRPESGGESLQLTSAGPVAAEYLLPSSGRGIAAQAVAALGLLTGLWVAVSPLFITLQHGGTNANVADVIAGLTAASLGVVALASPRGFPGLEFGSVLLGAWVIGSSFILAVKFTIATPMYWSNTFSGAVLAALALAGLACVRPATPH